MFALCGRPRVTGHSVIGVILRCLRLAASCPAYAVSAHPSKSVWPFGLLGLLLTGIGILRGNVPPQPASIAVALLIGGGVWFLVAWAVAAAAVDVERDVKGVEEIGRLRD
jgi:hypothetical protein